MNSSAPIGALDMQVDNGSGSAAGRTAANGAAVGRRRGRGRSGLAAVLAAAVVTARLVAAVDFDAARGRAARATGGIAALGLTVGRGKEEEEGQDGV